MTDQLPIIYIRGYAGPTSGIDSQVDDPFYGFNHGATHIRVGGDGDPAYYQFEGPMLRLITEEGYQLLVHGDQQQFLQDAPAGTVPANSLWVYRFYDQAATTFVAPPPPHGLAARVSEIFHRHVSSDGFNIEEAAAGLYELILDVREKTGADKVYLVAHSMGGLIARAMMQKTCESPDGNSARLAAKQIVAKLFTYGTPHGGISFDLGALNWAEQAFGPAGADIFAPAKMYGYLTPGKNLGDTPSPKDDWDPQQMDEKVFDPNDVFCVIGTDPKDYGLSRVVVGPRSDGLVRIEHAYVRKAHRAYVYKSHSGSYGEVNSEEGYQNLRRFLFGRWQVEAGLTDLADYSTDAPTWQADLRLAIRGLPVLVSEQQAEHWCPIQLNEELQQAAANGTGRVPLLSTFLLDPVRPSAGAGGTPAAAHGGRARHVLSLRVYQLDTSGRVFRFADHLEQVADWSDSLIVDIGPDDDGRPAAWAAWNQDVLGANADIDPIGPRLSLDGQDGNYSVRVPMPPAARSLAILGPNANLLFQLTDRQQHAG